MISGWLQLKSQLGFEDWVLDGPPGPKMVEFCVLLGTPYAPVSKIPSVNNFRMKKSILDHYYLLGLVRAWNYCENWLVGISALAW